MEGNTKELGDWGHEYVRTLSGEVGQEYDARTTGDTKESTDDLILLVKDIVPFHLQHNAEHDAVDLLIEVEMLELLLSEKSLDLVWAQSLVLRKIEICHPNQHLTKSFLI